jgi:hypothetical protein
VTAPGGSERAERAVNGGANEHEEEDDRGARISPWGEAADREVASVAERIAVLGCPPALG